MRSQDIRRLEHRINSKTVNNESNYKRQRKPKEKSRKDNQEKLATLGTLDQEEDKKNHQKTKKMSNTDIDNNRR